MKVLKTFGDHYRGRDNQVGILKYHGVVYTVVCYRRWYSENHERKYNYKVQIYWNSKDQWGHNESHEVPQEIGGVDFKEWDKYILEVLGHKLGMGQE